MSNNFEDESADRRSSWQSASDRRSGSRSDGSDRFRNNREGEGRPARRSNDRDDRGGRKFEDRGDRGGRRFNDRDDRGGRKFEDRGGRTGGRFDDRGGRRFEDRDNRGGGRNFSDRDDRGGRRFEDRGGRTGGRFDDRGGRKFEDRGGRTGGRSDDRGGRRFEDRDNRGGGRFEDRGDRQHAPRAGAGREDRVPEPFIPDEITSENLSKEARRHLLSLNKDNADRVARFLVMAGSLMDDDPELAYEHAKAAYRRAARIDIVREALGLTAYANEKYGEALRELRTYRRMSGDISHAYLEADCERGMGKPDRAVKYLEDINIQELEPAGQIELALVVSGAYAELEESEKGLKLIEMLKVDSFSEELRAPVEMVRVERLRELGREEEAAAVEAKWAPIWNAEMIEVFDEHIEYSEDSDDGSYGEDSWDDEGDGSEPSADDMEEKQEEMSPTEAPDNDRFADLRPDTAGFSDDEPEVDSDDFIDDAEPDDFVDQGDTPVNLEEDDSDEILESDDLADSDVSAIDTGEADPELEAELDSVDEDLADKDEEDSK